MRIPARFNGPPGSGNGGYSAGTFVGWHVGAGGAPCEVTLRRPPPLETPLSIVDDQVRGPDGEVVADLASVGPLDTSVPPVSVEEATRAAEDYAGFVEHPFPTCYVCGPERDDGLRIFPGPLGDGTTAAPWTVPEDVVPATVWAALDCPGGWAVIGAGRPYVLGRIAVEIGTVPAPGDVCVVRGALAETEGRKALVHTTLYGPDGAELARARATWLSVR
jgi:hypothetical protein